MVRIVDWSVSKRQNRAVTEFLERSAFPEEAEKAEKAGLSLLGLGKRILRTESAAAFVLACLSSEFELR